MKRRIMVIWLICALLACPATAMGEAAPGPVVWEQRAYVDEFNMPTDDYYTGHSSPIVGTFSNSATQGSLLYVFFFIDKTVSIRLVEYGNSAVNNPYSSGRTYNVVMMDTEGKKYNFEGQIMSGRDTLDFSSEESRTIIAALSKPGIVRFAITDADQPLTKYIFSVESDTGLPYTSAYMRDGIISFTQGGAEGLMDCSGNVIVAPGEYDRVSSFSEGLAEVALGEEYYDELFGIPRFAGQWGFVDTSGALIIPLEYDYTAGFSEGLAMVEKDDKYGFIDTSGALIVPCEYDYAYSFSEGLASVQKDDKWGFIDTSGTLVVPCEYDDAYVFSEGLASVRKDDKGGFIDTSGALVIPCEYDAAGDFSDGLARVKVADKWGFIDTSGALVIPCEYDSTGDFSDGLAPVQKDEKWGFIDTSGTLVVPCEYDIADNFSDGLASVKKDGKYGFIDTSGTLVVPCEYDIAFDFSDGLTSVEKDGKRGCIDTSGKFIVPCEYDNISHDGNQIVLFKGGQISVVPR
ncbi:MAG TPA: WG repeat-containing protein [Candidatus Faecaligallichristensenella faecipullorum]|nr:WG repeat-containing protein [Candidatus Faecaligallichristensenella faecipullorum]